MAFKKLPQEPLIPPEPRVPFEERVFTLEEFAKWARIGPSVAYDEIKSNRLHAVKAGSRTLISGEAALWWLKTLPPASMYLKPKKGTDTSVICAHVDQSIGGNRPVP